MARMHYHLLVFSISRILKTSPDVLLRQIREITEDIFIGHAGREVLENIIDGDAHAPDARLPATLTVFDCDDVFVTIHDTTPRCHFSGLLSIFISLLLLTPADFA